MAAAIDDSCRRPGSIPFKWEICPGTPKHVRSSSESAAPTPSPSPYSSATVSKVAVSPKLTPPPAMSPSPYHSPRVSYYSSSAAARSSASVSPSRRRGAHHRPTAFLDVNPRVAPTYRAAAGAVEDDEAASSRCFPLPVFRRRERDGGRKGGRRSARTGTGTGTASSGSSSAGSSLWSDYYGAALPAPGGLRRSVSTSSSSSCLSLSSRSSGKLAEAREVEAAGGWFY